MYQILANYSAMTGSAAYGSLAAVADQNFVPRNNKWFFTEDYYLMAAGIFSADVTAAQLYDATWNAINTPQLYPVNLNVGPPSNPQMVDYRSWPVKIPQSEEIDVQCTNGNAMAADAFSLLMISPTAKPPALPMASGGLGSFGRVKAKFTVTGALTKGSWSSDLIPTFSGVFKGGSYCLVGCQIVCASATAYRVNFVRAPLHQGRKLSPGGLIEDTYGNVPLAQGLDWLGPQGYFNTFEPPYIALLANTTAGSATYTGYMDLIYLGENMTINQI